MTSIGIGIGDTGPVFTWYRIDTKFAVLHTPTPESAPWTMGAGRHIWAGRHVSLSPPPISLVYDTAELIGVDLCAWAFFYIRFYEWSTLFGCTTEILSANNSDFS